ncbi:MAG: hypothetical protein HPY72_10345 [Anaerolineae bacterium]|jgi:hypothetical protein|nr:hypothetical protein [Anaerolineae bacterium]
MKKGKWLKSTALGAILVLLLACRVSLGGGDSSDVQNAIQQTLQVIQTQTAAAQPVPSSGESQSTGSTDSAAVAEVEETPTVNPTPCNASRMVDETIPDGKHYDPGDSFTKTWTLRNNGSCEWNTDYRFVFEEGDRMGGDTSQYLDEKVEPGEEVTFSLDLTAPDEDGEYTGVWRLLADDGEKLGKYWVSIVVGNPPGPFAVTSVTFYMPHTTIDTGCPNDINVKAEITSNAAGKVTYKWADSAGGSSSTKSYTFNEAGKKIVEYNVTAGSSGDYWAKLYIDNPNHQWFGPMDFHVNCTP